MPHNDDEMQEKALYEAGRLREPTFRLGNREGRSEEWIDLALSDEEIIEGLAEALWHSTLYHPTDVCWENEYEWVKVKWRRFARVAVGYLAQVAHQTQPTPTDNDPV